MDNEPEDVIKQQMSETRASLAEKLETLEQQVVGTVQNATTAVTDTVESVKDAVQQTVETAKASVRETVEAVKETFDLSEQVRKRPWMMMAGSVAVGYAAGQVLQRFESAGSEAHPGYASSLSTLAAQSHVERDGGMNRRSSEETFSSRAASASTAQRMFGDLTEKFHTELHKLKGLALGTMFGVVRELIANSVPPQLSSELAEIIDSATVKLGGQPIHGSVLNMFQGDSTCQAAHGQGASQRYADPFPTAYPRAGEAERTVD
jgi:ElaB/YqjD/DUF883 family membrane-anchored ribosome-binding protein